MSLAKIAYRGCCVFAVLAVGIACAQEEETSVEATPSPEIKPKEPLVMLAPDKTMWKVTTHYKNPLPGETATGDRPAGTSVQTVRKAGKLLQEKLERGGRVYNSVVVGTIRISDQGVKDNAAIISLNDWLYPEYGETDFDHFRWVDMKHYVGVQKYKGRDVFVFRVKGDEKKLNSREVLDYEYWQRHPGASKPLCASDSVAMIDVKTQLPVYFSDDELDETIEFLPAPTDPISIPKKFQTMLLRELDFQKTAPQSAKK